jgi:hypothetical protein
VSYDPLYFHEQPAETRMVSRVNSRAVRKSDRETAKPIFFSCPPMACFDLDRAIEAESHPAWQLAQLRRVRRKETAQAKG